MDPNEAHRAMNVRHDLDRVEFGLGMWLTAKTVCPRSKNGFKTTAPKRSESTLSRPDWKPPLTRKITPMPFCFAGFQTSIVKAIPEFAPVDIIRVALVCQARSLLRDAQCKDGQSRRSNSNHDTHFLSAAERVMEIALRHRSRFSGRIFNPQTSVHSTSAEPGHSVPRESAAAAHGSAP